MDMTTTLLARARGTTPPTALASFVLAALLVALLAGCKVSKDQVVTWGKEKDSGRLQRVVKDPKQAMDVRIEAARQLVGIGRFYELERSLRSAGAGDRQKIAGALVATLLPRIEEPDEAEVVRAKDGLFSAWYFAASGDRQKIEDALVRWVVRSARAQSNEASEHPTPKILAALGRRGANRIAALVPPDDEALFTYDRDKVVGPNSLLALFWKTAGEPAVAEAARRFMKAATQDPKLAMARDASLLCAIGAIGKAEGVAYLTGLLRDSPDVMLRAAALVALMVAGEVDRSLLGAPTVAAASEQLGKILADYLSGKLSVLPTLRGGNYMIRLFELLALVGSPEAVEALLRLVGSPTTPITEEEPRKYRTLLRLLAVGYLGKIDPDRALTRGLDALPEEDAYHQGILIQSVLELWASLAKAPQAKRDALLRTLRKAVSHPRIVGRLIAIESLALPPTELPREDLDQDLAALAKAAGDTARPTGDDWKNATLAERAKEAIEKLKSAKKKP
jgi:hypothetical protein